MSVCTLFSKPESHNILGLFPKSNVENAGGGAGHAETTKRRNAQTPVEEDADAYCREREGVRLEREREREGF